MDIFLGYGYERGGGLGGAPGISGHMYKDYKGGPPWR